MKLASLFAVGAGIVFCISVWAHDAHRHHQDAASSEAGTVKVFLSDGPLLDQAGRLVRLPKDVIGERIAVVNFVYTACTTVCPISSASLAQLQERLGAVVGSEVVLVSITVDPVRDTPQRLRDYAGRFGAREGWVWLTGAKRDVDAVLKGFGAYTSNFEDHPTMVLVGDARGGWTRFFGFPSVELLLSRAAAASAARRDLDNHAKE